LAAEPTPIRSIPVAAPLSQVGADLSAPVRWALAVPLVATLGFGLLYATGAVVKSAQMRDAGLSPADVLPIVPFGQVMTLGVDAALAALVLLPLVLVAALLLRGLARETQRKESVDDVVARLIADHQQLRGLARAPSTEAAEHFERRLRRLDGRSARIKARVRRRRLIVAGLTVAGSLVLAFALTPAALAGAVLSVWLVDRYRWHTGFAVAIVFAAMLVAVVVERAAAPAPIPAASVRTTGGHLIEGRLITVTQRAWYIEEGGGRVRSVPIRHVARSSVRPEGHSGPRTVGERVAGAF
jgi:hypothetical protein